VELEADARPWLHVSHTGQKQCRDDFAVGRALLNATGDFFEQLFPRRLFDRADERLDVARELDDLRIGPSFFRRDGREFAEEAQLRCAGQGSGRGGGGQELAAIGREWHSPALR
jgi:hypothetical protein